jgi:hypothetical protein
MADTEEEFELTEENIDDVLTEPCSLKSEDNAMPGSES